MNTITRYCVKDGGMFEVEGHSMGRYPSLDPAHSHKKGEPTLFCTRCGGSIGVLPSFTTVYCESCRNDAVTSGGKVYNIGAPSQPRSHHQKEPTVANTKSNQVLDPKTIELIRKTLGNEAVSKMQRAAKVERFVNVSLTVDLLVGADRYLSWVIGQHEYEESQERRTDQFRFITIVEQVVATNITAQRIVKGFLDKHRVDNGKPPLRWEGIYIICPEGCGKKFLPDAIDQHTRMAHDLRTNYAAQAKEGV